MKPAAESAHQSVWRNALQSMVHVLGAVSDCLIFDRASVVEACLEDQSKKSTNDLFTLHCLQNSKSAMTRRATATASHHPTSSMIWFYSLHYFVPKLTDANRIVPSLE